LENVQLKKFDQECLNILKNDAGSECNSSSNAIAEKISQK
jgi:hypothetical protein